MSLDSWESILLAIFLGGAILALILLSLSFLARDLSLPQKAELWAMGAGIVQPLVAVALILAVMFILPWTRDRGAV